MNISNGHNGAQGPDLPEKQIPVLLPMGCQRTVSESWPARKKCRDMLQLLLNTRLRPSTGRRLCARCRRADGVPAGQIWRILHTAAHWLKEVPDEPAAGFIFPAEMTTALYRWAIASTWRQKMLNETGNDQYGPHSLTVERIEMAIALHIECALINEYGEVLGRRCRAGTADWHAGAVTATALPVPTARGCEVMAEMYRTARRPLMSAAAPVWRCIREVWQYRRLRRFQPPRGEMARYSADAAYWCTWKRQARSPPEM